MNLTFFLDDYSTKYDIAGFTLRYRGANIKIMPIAAQYQSHDGQFTFYTAILRPGKPQLYS